MKNRILHTCLILVLAAGAGMLIPSTSHAADSTVPTTDAAAVVIRAYEGNRLCWYHTCPGDYNQDGMVTASDITPFGLYFDTSVVGDDVAFPDYNVLSLVDGNGDGYITSADITPVGVHYGMDVLGGYRLYVSDDAADYPGSSAGPNGAGAELIASVGFSENATWGDGDTSYNGSEYPPRRWYEAIVEDPTVYEYWWIRAVDRSGNEGTPSELWRNPGKEVPITDDARALASWDLETSTLNWYYYHLGDYSLNGMVESTDLTMIGTHFGQENTGDPNSIAYIIDTNGSGDVDQGDIEVVGDNWGSMIYRYNVYVSTSAADYPSSNDSTSVLDPVATVDFTDAGFGFSDARPLLSIELPGLTPGQYVWVRACDYIGYEGTPSNLVEVE